MGAEWKTVKDRALQTVICSIETGPENGMPWNSLAILA
jgi:hypothetical protein